MAERWIVTTSKGRGSYTTDDVRMYDKENDVLTLVADIAADSSYDSKRLEHIHKITLGRQPSIEAYEPALVNMKLVLQVKE